MLRKKEKGKMVSTLKLWVFSISFKDLNETLAKLKGHERTKATSWFYCFSAWFFVLFSCVSDNSPWVGKVDGLFVWFDCSGSTLYQLQYLWRRVNFVSQQWMLSIFLLNTFLTVCHIFRRYKQHNSRNKCNFRNLYQTRTQVFSLLHHFPQKHLRHVL